MTMRITSTRPKCKSTAKLRQ